MATMTDAAGLTFALAGAGGALIGLLYFGILWWTVRRIPTARFPAALVAGTFLVRATLAAAGIVVVSRGEFLPLLTAIAGFLVARTILIRVVGRSLDHVRPAGNGAVPAKDVGSEL